MQVPASRACVLLLALLSGSGAARAVCLDPVSGVSGYRVSLETEVHDADAIVVGRVLAEQALKEDAADPEGVTAYDLTVAVRARLKGNTAGRIVVRNENTSARYPMAVGEEHLLFVTRGPQGATVNSCGNSSPMPAARRLLDRVRRAIRLQ
jgi:hypothetical protein